MKFFVALSLVLFTISAQAFVTCNSKTEANLAVFAALQYEVKTSGSRPMVQDSFLTKTEGELHIYQVDLIASRASNYEWSDYVAIQNCKVVGVKQ